MLFATAWQAGIHGSTPVSCGLMDSRVPLQQTVGTVLQSIMNRPDIKRPEVLEILKYLQQPMTGVEIKELRAIYTEYQNKSDPIFLVKKCLTRARKYGLPRPQHLKKETPKITREDLHLTCFDVLS